MRKVLLLALLSLMALPLQAEMTYQQSKKLLRHVYRDHQVDFYCGCPYEYGKNGRGVVASASCGYVYSACSYQSELEKYDTNFNMDKATCDKIKAKNKADWTDYIEWEHIVPVSKVAKEYACWKDKKLVCSDDKSLAKSGRKCCGARDKAEKELLEAQEANNRALRESQAAAEKALREAEEANRKKLAALEAEQQKLREEERKELEAQIAKVKNDANTSLEDKDRKIAELNKQIADSLDKARKACSNYSTTYDFRGDSDPDLRVERKWDEEAKMCIFETWKLYR